MLIQYLMSSPSMCTYEHTYICTYNKHKYRRTYSTYKHFHGTGRIPNIRIGLYVYMYIRTYIHTCGDTVYKDHPGDQGNVASVDRWSPYRGVHISAVEVTY